MLKFKQIIVILVIISFFQISYLKRNKKYDEEDEEEEDQYEDKVNGSPRNRNYKGKDIFGPIIGFGPFKIDKGRVRDRSYDVGYILGQGYGFKLSEGIKNGIKKGLKPGFFKKKDRKIEDNDEDRK